MRLVSLPCHLPQPPSSAPGQTAEGHSHPHSIFSREGPCSVLGAPSPMWATLQIRWLSGLRPGTGPCQCWATARPLLRVRSYGWRLRLGWTPVPSDFLVLVFIFFFFFF